MDNQFIDMRLRPPIPAFADCMIYRGSPSPTGYYPTRLGFPRPPSAEAASLEMLFDEMDRATIRYGVIMGRAGTTMGTVSNDALCEFVRAHGDRFVWYAGLDLADIPRALSEMSRWSADKSVRGFAIEPAISLTPKMVDDPAFLPLYEAAQATGKPLSISLSALMGPDLSYSDPEPLQRVARNFPRLTIVVSHGAWPWVHQVLGVAFVCDNVYVSPDLYMNGADFPAALEYARAARTYLRERLLFGTAYPSRPLVESVAAFRELELPEPVMRDVAYNNAARLLMID